MPGRRKLIIPQEELSSPEYTYSLPQETMAETSAPLTKRLAAFIIDFLAYNIILYPIFLRTFQLTSGLRNELINITYLTLHPELMSVMFGVIIASSVIFCLYMALSEYVFGETVGKHIMNIHVEGKADLWAYVARNMLKSTFIFALPIDLLGLLFYNKRLIDKALGINVLYTRKLQVIEGLI